MVAKDPQLRLVGYESYRFGGYKIYMEKENVLPEGFPEELFTEIRIL